MACYVLHSVIRPGGVAGYCGTHARVPDNLAALFGQAGIDNWTIWRSGDRLFHLIETDDLGSALAVIGPHPANRAWQRQIGPFVDHYRNTDGDAQFAPLNEVWSLAGQLSSAPSRHESAPRPQNLPA
ncbi:L-rhamnose mutarotase [Microbacterium sp. BK668]|nr:L-rhamnose mutarotase [Microbacterium sp. BK668]